MSEDSRIRWFVLHPAAFLRALELVERGYSPEEVMFEVMDMAIENMEELEDDAE